MYILIRMFVFFIYTYEIKVFMDQKLLQALNNVSFALESLVEAIESKNESSSSTANAIKGGDFGKQLETITTQIKDIKVDTEKILKNQETIISLSKENESKKTESVENAGTPEQQSNIKKGVGVILLIAGAVLAIGLAFKIVGQVDFLSVISISLAVTILSVAFEKIASLENLTIKSALISGATMVIMSVALAISSIALGMVQPVGLAQLFTATFIAAIFVPISYSMSGLVKAFKGMNLKDVIITAIALPLVLPAMALSIAGASYALKLVQPIGLVQFFSALLIGVIFAVLALGLKMIISAFKGIDPATAAVAGLVIPILFTAMSLAIMASSHILSNVVPVSFGQFVTSLFISLTFVVIAYALAPVIKLSDNIKAGSLVKLPILFTVMSLAIMLSSHILAESADIGIGQMIKAGILGAILAGLAFIMVPVIKTASKLGIGEILKGGLAILAIAATVMVSSHILAFGDYGNYPDLSWILGVGISLTTFGLAAFALGALVFGPQALIFLAGLAAILGVAGTILGVSEILSKGTYDNKGMLDWAVATALLYATFTPIMLILGTAALASAVISIFGPDPWKMAQEAILDVADTIVEVSHRLQKGSYTGGPTKEWAEGIAIALGAFSPVYGMLMKNAIFEIFGGGGVGPEEFTSAILTVTDGIITAANKFAGNKTAFIDGPSEAWAKGVGGAIGAFAPVFKVLAEQDGGFFGSDGPSVEDMSRAILTITAGIITAAGAFADNEAIFNDKYPSVKWGEGVGASITAFAPVFDALSGRSWYESGDGVIGNMTKGIRAITGSLLDAAYAFAGYTFDWKTFKYVKGSMEGNIWSAYPSEKWASGVSKAVSSFLGLFDKVKSKGYTLEEFKKNASTLKYGVSSMAMTAGMLWKSKDYFDLKLNENFVENISKNVLGFANLGIILDKLLVTREKATDSSWGGFVKKEKVITITKDMDIVSKVTASMINVARILHDNKEVFSTKIDPGFMKNIGTNILDFNNILNQLIKSEDTGGFMSSIGDMFSEDPVTQIAKRMMTLAKGYDAIAESLIKLSVAMKAINVSDAASLGGITRSIVSPGEVSDNNLSGGNKKTSSEINTIKSTSSVNPINNFKQDKELTIGDKLDKLIELLSNVDKSTQSLDELVGDAVEGSNDPKSDKSWF